MPLIVSNEPSVFEAVGLTVRLPANTTTRSMAKTDKMDVEQINKNGVVIDELACFIVNKMKILPTNSIVRLCTGAFDNSEIEESKRKLFDLCADLNTIRVSKRQGPKKNSKNIEDMIKLLTEKGSDIPTFVALDLSRLPPITFDSLDVSVLLNAIKKTQNEVDALKDCAQSHNDATQSEGYH